MPVYGANVRALIHTFIFEKRQAIYLRFCFAIFRMVEGSLSSPVIGIVLFAAA